MVQNLPLTHPLRQQYKQEFARIPADSKFAQVAKFWSRGPIKTKTSAEFKRAAQEVMPPVVRLRLNKHNKHLSAFILRLRVTIAGSASSTRTTPGMLPA